MSIPIRSSKILEKPEYMVCLVWRSGEDIISLHCTAYDAVHNCKILLKKGQKASWRKIDWSKDEKSIWEFESDRRGAYISALRVEPEV